VAEAGDALVAGPASPPLVEVSGLEKRFRVGGETVRAIDGVSFEIRRGETFGLVGESGSGKSTVARCLLRMLPADAGRVRFDGEDLGSLRTRELRSMRKRMQIVFQDPHGSLNRRSSVARIVAAPLEAHGVGDRTSRRARVKELLELVGLSAGIAARRPGEMSGGQAQRVAIARALALEPELVVLDEAVSALDVSVRAQILNLLRKLQAELGLTYLFISHDLSVVRYMCQRVAVMYLGRIVEEGARGSLFGAAKHPYTQGLMAAVPVADPVRERARPRLVVPRDGGSAMHLPSGCRFHPRCPIGRDLPECHEQDPLLEPEGEHRVACHHPQVLAHDAALDIPA
jgi:oligopeptide/dipeptide ABC transporter ATP-binding protein